MSRLDEITARRSAVHNAPWTFQPWGQNANQNGDHAESIVFDADGWEIADGIADTVGEFIAHAPDDIDWLISELKKAQQEDMSICEQAWRDGWKAKADHVAKMHQFAAGFINSVPSPVNPYRKGENE